MMARLLRKSVDQSVNNILTIITFKIHDGINYIGKHSNGMEVVTNVNDGRRLQLDTATGKIFYNL